MATTELTPRVTPAGGLVTLTHVLYWMHAFGALIRGWLALLDGKLMPVPEVRG